jgi:glycerol uptake facilitator-like aquaporin
MDEPSVVQQLSAEVIGTAFLVFIGVGPGVLVR